MSAWSHDELERIASSTELQLASQRCDGGLRPYVTMWVVGVGGELYVRSAYEPDNPWYKRAKASRLGRIRAGGIERDVEFAAPPVDAHDDIDAAYHAKYDRYGQNIVGTVVGPSAHEVTIRLVPTGTGQD